MQLGEKLHAMQHGVQNGLQTPPAIQPCEAELLACLY